MPDIPLPPSCSVEALAEWLDQFTPVDLGASITASVARAVRALLEAKVREAVRFCSYDDETDAHVSDVVRHVIGSPS